MRTLKLNKVRISAFLGAVALMMMVTFFAVNAMTVQAADSATEETVATEKAADNSISGKAVGRWPWYGYRSFQIYRSNCSSA